MPLPPVHNNASPHVVREALTVVVPLPAAVNVRFAVPHHEMPHVIAAADVCVAPLALNDRNVTQGCCPIKVIEYMSCARPIVAANLPVVRELVREDVDALLFAPDDAEDLARQIGRVLDDVLLAKKLATNAAERARSKLTWHTAQKKLLKVYDKLVVDVAGRVSPRLARRRFADTA